MSTVAEAPHAGSPPMPILASSTIEQAGWGAGSACLP